MLRYLKTFAAAAELASFSNAAARLGLTQSAVSMQIKRLEDDLDCQLFERCGKSVLLSARGRELLETAQEILRLYGGMKGHKLEDGVRGKVDLGAISTVQLALLPQALALFRSRLPLVEVNVVPGTSVQLMSHIDSNELAIAVMIKPSLRMTGALLWTTLMRETYVAIAPSGSRENTLRALLRSHPFIRYSRRSYGGQLVDRYLKRHRIQVRENMELDEPAVILEMVRQGLGVSIIPFELAAAGSANHGVRFLSLEDAECTREIGILQRLSTASDQTIDTLVTSLADAAARKTDSGSMRLAELLISNR
ncbi:MAG: LysR family transcriptional regulator [Janthinobacterium lividum]